jgi:hypothetical protein
MSGSEAARGRLREIIEDVIGADGGRYGATDDAGHSMDCAKIIQDAAGDYLAVYHAFVQGRFHVLLGVSRDLVNWSFAADLGRSASQATIYPAAGGYLVAWEQEPRNHIAVRYYADRAALFAGRAARSFDARRTLSRCAEGTPTIHAAQHLDADVDQWVIELGGHYWWKCDRDRQMHATLTGFRRWKATARADLDEGLLRFGVGGNIGGRDPVVFSGHSFRVVEGQFVKGDFGSWRTFVWDEEAGIAEEARVRTDRGSTAFANPHATVLNEPGGRRALLVSLFLPGEGAARGEGGPLLYYRVY